MQPLRIGILGAGPAGLYAALLLKNQNPAHQVTVIERNPADATFGFGVVLSDRTLEGFRVADPASFDEITAHQSSWGAIQVCHGAPVWCGGHSYVGIARQRLLTILQRRCEALGVHLQFETEVTDLGALGEFDLVIAADGVNSLARRTHAAAFGPSIERGHSTYIWLGVKWIPAAFTFIFHETEHGLFQAHIYPFDAETSTCIVMCRDETWERAGLDRLDEASSVRFCQELLRPYLGDAPFLANRSLWSTFQTVKNQRWSHGRIVLLGDAAHTAHWSIGSGTKLAMEDAIALVGALGREAKVEEALAAYERERRPVVERLQEAARISELACENAERYTHLEPVPFAFQLLTRSGRLDYEGLKQRDPAFIAQVDHWFSAQTEAAELTSPALTPLPLGDLILQNRLVTTCQEPWRDHLAAFRTRHGQEPGLILISGAASLATLQELKTEAGCKVGLMLETDGQEAELRQSIQAAATLGVDLLLLSASGGKSLLPAAVRAVWPQGRPLAIALPLAAEPPPGWDLYCLQPANQESSPAHLIAGSDRIRNELRVTTMVGAASLAEANTIIAGSRADLCWLAIL